MKRNRNYLVLPAIYLAVALPGIAALVLYHFTKNPLLRPLGITKESLAEIDDGRNYTSILVHVAMGRDRTDGISRADMRNLISGAFATRTDNFFFRFTEPPGDRIGVTFVVGPNSYGPYPTGRLIDGIIPALAALKMYQNESSRESEP